VLPAVGVEEGGAGAHFEEDVLAREVGEVFVVLFDQLGERDFSPIRSAGFGHGSVVRRGRGRESIAVGVVHHAGR